MNSHEDLKNAKSRMYSQLQPWSVVGAPPCMTIVQGPEVPVKVAQSFKTTKPHPWRPAMSYENVEINGLPEQPIMKEFTSPCITSQGTAAEQVAFPNLVTGFERNPQHGARAALYTRYTLNEWMDANSERNKEASSNRLQSEHLRAEATRLLKETDETTTLGQRETGRRLGERITDVTFWRNELNAELEKLVSESTAFADLKERCAKATLELEGPLHIAQECLYQRESRSGMEKVHDCVERSLLLEIDNVRGSRLQLRDLYDKIAHQANDCRAAQHLLEDDVYHKQSTLGIDSVCHSLTNYSRGIAFYGGIEGYDPSVSTQETWAEASSMRVNRSQAERAKLSQLRTDADTVVSQISQSIWDFWTYTNNAFEQRITELNDAKNKIQAHLSKLQDEIFHIENLIGLIQKAIDDKVNPMKVAHTRLEARTHREDIELCRDWVHDRLVVEVGDINKTVDVLHKKLLESEARHQALLKTRNELEDNLRQKINAIFIDREKCMGLRRAYALEKERKLVRNEN